MHPVYQKILMRISKIIVEEFLIIFQTGFEYNSKLYTIEIRRIIADAPARASLLNIPTLSGYNSCHKCTIKRFYFLHRVTFPYLKCPLRTDLDFIIINNTFLSHHNSSKMLQIERLPIGCVTNIAIYYMHCVLLGVINQILYACVSHRRKLYRFKSSKILDL